MTTSPRQRDSWNYHEWDSEVDGYEFVETGWKVNAELGPQRPRDKFAQCDAPEEPAHEVNYESFSIAMLSSPKVRKQERHRLKGKRMSKRRLARTEASDVREAQAEAERRERLRALVTARVVEATLQEQSTRQKRTRARESKSSEVECLSSNTTTTKSCA